MTKRASLPVWHPDPELDDSVLIWRAVVRKGLTRRRSLLHPFGSGYGPIGFMGGLGAGTGGKLFTGPAADGLTHAQQSAISSDSPHQDTVARRTAASQLAALELLDSFDRSDRARLRDAGELPDWFPAELRSRSAEVEKRLRQSGT